MLYDSTETMGERIRRVNGYDQNAYTYYPIIVIGGGASGIATACKLKSELGFDQFRVFDRQSGIGGTWWINRYPGIACDVPAAFYSFSFCQNPNWTSFHPPGREIVQYFHEVLAKFEITDKFELNTAIDRCRWLEDEQMYEVTLRRFIAGMGDLSSKDRAKIVQEQGESAIYSETEIVRAKIVVSCVGGIVEPKAWPDNIPGVQDFKGKIFHSARWDDSLDYADKNVVVVGTGCSSAQLVPRLPKEPYNAKKVTQLMRSPPWVVPSNVPPGGDEWWEKNGPSLMRNVPGLLQLLRLAIAAGAEYNWFRLFPQDSHKGRKTYEAEVLAHMKSLAPEKYHALMTPNYSVGCKRRIFDKAWLSSLNNPKIELTAQPIHRVTEHGVVIGPGTLYPPNAEGDFPEREVPADIIVLANGYETQKWLHPLQVQGKNGQDLVETMEERGGGQAYLGQAMDGFPNFFMIYGPNTVTGHSSVIMASENMVMHALQLIKPILKGEISSVDIKYEVEVAYTKDIQKACKNTVMMTGGCSSWYFSEDGWNSTAYPYSQIDFWWRCLFPRWNHWVVNYTEKGLAARRRRRTTRVLGMALAVAGLYRLYQRGISLAEMKGVATDSVRKAVDALFKVLTHVKTKLV